MSFIKPIAYWQQPLVVSTPTGGIPKPANILLRYENVNVNGSGTTWTDTSGLGYTTGLIEKGTSATSTALIDAASNSVQIGNTSSTNGARTGRLRITTNTNISIKSLVVVFNTWTNQGGTGSSRNYLMDFRRANLESPGNGGYFNQYDGVGIGATELYGNNGHYFAYNSADDILLGSQLTTPANLTNGINNNNGGSANDQYYGPNARLAYLPKRMWLFNFNTNKNLNLTTTALRGMVMACGDGLTEGSSMGWFSIIGWSDYLDATDAAQLVSYYKSTGTL